MSKKLLAIVAVMAALTLTASAAFAEMTMQVGALGGVQIADLTGDDIDDTSTRTGFVGGGFFGLGFNENFGARVEVLYSMKGAKSDEAGGEEITWKLDYVEIPVLAVGMFPVNESFTLSVFAGPAIGINITSEFSNGETVDADEITKSTDFGAMFGIGGQFPAGSVNIFVQGRATVGLTSIADDEGDPDVKTIAYGGVVGVGVPLNSE